MRSLRGGKIAQEESGLLVASTETQVSLVKLNFGKQIAVLCALSVLRILGFVEFVSLRSTCL